MKFLFLFFCSRLSSLLGRDPPDRREDGKMALDDDPWVVFHLIGGVTGKRFFYYFFKFFSFGWMTNQTLLYLYGYVIAAWLFVERGMGEGKFTAVQKHTPYETYEPERRPGSGSSSGVLFSFWLTVWNFLMVYGYG